MTLCNAQSRCGSEIKEGKNGFQDYVTLWKTSLKSLQPAYSIAGLFEYVSFV
jgi:hypothetical protein